MKIPTYYGYRGFSGAGPAELWFIYREVGPCLVEHDRVAAVLPSVFIQNGNVEAK
jgi:hypothetical protein